PGRGGAEPRGRPALRLRVDPRSATALKAGRRRCPAIRRGLTATRRAATVRCPPDTEPTEPRALRSNRQPGPSGNGARTLFRRMMNALMDEHLVRGFPPTLHSAVALVRSGD